MMNEELKFASNNASHLPRLSTLFDPSPLDPSPLDKVPPEDAIHNTRLAMIRGVSRKNRDVVCIK